MPGRTGSASTPASAAHSPRIPHLSCAESEPRSVVSAARRVRSRSGADRHYGALTTNAVLAPESLEHQRRSLRSPCSPHRPAAAGASPREVSLRHLRGGRSEHSVRVLGLLWDWLHYVPEL